MIISAVRYMYLGMFRISLLHVGGFLLHAQQHLGGVHEGGLLALECPLRGRPLLHHARCEAFFDPMTSLLQLIG
jgi:hypothetical protein